MKELTITERKAIRAFGGWRLVSLLVKPDAKPEVSQGGNSHPRGFGEGCWLAYDRKGIRVEQRRAPVKDDGYRSTTPDIIAKVTWAQVKRVGQELSPDLRRRLTEVHEQQDRHARQGYKMQYPRLHADPDDKPAYEKARAEWEARVEKFQKEVRGPWMAVGAQLEDKINQLLDEALEGNQDLRDAYAAIERSKLLLVGSGG